jgi:hypothetical protein
MTWENDSFEMGCLPLNICVLTAAQQPIKKAFDLYVEGFKKRAIFYYVLLSLIFS